MYIGYNALNEVYVGFQFPTDSVRKIVMEAGYQFTFSDEAARYNLINPTLTLKAYGLRARIGFQFPKDQGKGFKCILFEYQDLQSVLFYTESGRSSSQVATFKESYRKYGMRVSRIIPLKKGSPVSFVYSYGLFYMDVIRNYETEGIVHFMQPSDRVEYFQKFTIQLSIGLRFYL